MNPRDFEERFKRNTIPAMPLSENTCSKCYSSGFAWINADGAFLWAYCSCSEGTNKSRQDKYNLPRLDAELLKIFKLEPFPKDSFLPNPFSDNWQKELWSKVRKFKESLKKSEDTWNGKC